MPIVTEDIKAIDAYRDPFGLIAQADGDGGDTLNKTGMFYGCLAILFEQHYSVLMINDRQSLSSGGFSDGRYVRHPDPKRWYSNPNNVTRDQTMPWEAALILNGYFDLLGFHLRARAKRLFFHFSTENGGMDMGPVVRKFPDPPSPDEIAMLIRANKLLAFLLAPLLFFLDLFLLVGVCCDVQEGKIVLCCAISKRMPTPVSALAIWVLKNKATTDAEITAYWNRPQGVKPMAKLVIAAKEAL